MAAEARYVDRRTGGALTPLAGFGAIFLTYRDARTLENFARHCGGHLVDRDAAFSGATRIELAALDVVLINATPKVGGDCGAKDEA